MNIAIYIGGGVYFLGALAFAFITRKTFGPEMGFHWWAPLAFGFGWPGLVVVMVHSLWQDRKRR